MKSTLIIILLLFSGSFRAISQEISLGGNLGIIPLNKNYTTLGASFEYKRDSSILSYNIDPFLFYADKKFLMTAPAYIKCSFGKKVRLCPLGGGFIRSNHNYGFLYGLEIDCIIKRKYMFYISGNRYIDNWKEEQPTHFGTMKVSRNEGSSLFSIGIKKYIRR